MMFYSANLAIFLKTPSPKKGSACLTGYKNNKYVLNITLCIFAFMRRYLYIMKHICCINERERVTSPLMATVTVASTIRKNFSHAPFWPCMICYFSIEIGLLAHTLVTRNKVSFWQLLPA